MTRLVHTALLMLLLILTQSSCVLRPFTEKTAAHPAPVVPLKGYGTLANVPFREGWYGMYFQEDKVGYSHFEIQPSGRNFKISSDSVMRLTALRKTNEITMKEKLMVRPDLSLISFESLVRMNGKDLRMIGRVEGSRFHVDLAVDGEQVNRQYPIEGPIYHSSAISLMPAIKGLEEGRSYSFPVFNPEKQGMEKVSQQVFKVMGKPGPNGAVWKVKNKYGRSLVYSWLDRKGLTVLEKALEGSLITMLEDRATARNILKKKGPGRDLVLDFSLIRVSKPIPRSEKVRYLKILMKGVDRSFIPDDHRQRISGPKQNSSSNGFEVAVRSEDAGSRAGKGKSLTRPLADENLASTVSIQSDHREIVDQAQRIVSPNDSDLEKVTKLVRWTARNVKNKMKDSFTALSVLRSREGECQSHANLYTALARSQKIPTRVVTGLVYTPDVGFLYHAWTESYVNGWLAVDPTLDQVPADATHIKVSSGDRSQDMNSLLKMVGKVKIEVQEFK
jgi:hypothetical protein